MSGNFAIKGGGGVGRLMANAILNFHFDYLNPSLTEISEIQYKVEFQWKWKIMDDLVKYNSHSNTFSSTVAYDWLSWSWNISVLLFSLTLGRREFHMSAMEKLRFSSDHLLGCNTPSCCRWFCTKNNPRLDWHKRLRRVCCTLESVR